MRANRENQSAVCTAITQCFQCDSGNLMSLTPLSQARVHFRFPWRDQPHHPLPQETANPTCMYKRRKKMKYGLFGVLTLGLLIFLAPTATAATACIDFTGFCDSIQITKDSAGNQFGLWNADCAATLSPIIGRGNSIGGRILFDIGSISSAVYVFVIDQNARTFDMFGSDGSFTFQNLDDAAFTVTPGNCPFTLTFEKQSKPRLTD
jgi:hypothetical protein